MLALTLGMLFSSGKGGETRNKTRSVRHPLPKKSTNLTDGLKLHHYGGLVQRIPYLLIGWPSLKRSWRDGKLYGRLNGRSRSQRWKNSNDDKEYYKQVADNAYSIYLLGLLNGVDIRFLPTLLSLLLWVDTHLFLFPPFLRFLASSYHKLRVFYVSVVSSTVHFGSSISLQYSQTHV